MTVSSPFAATSRRRRRADAATTATPGSTAIIARTPNAVEAATPVAAPMPAAPKAHAATPSRGPQPPRFSGIDPASSTMSAPAVSRSGEAATPTAMQATTKVATWQATTTIGGDDHDEHGADGLRTPVAASPARA